MYCCIGCGAVFDQPISYKEDTNEPLPGGVKWKGCPFCQGDFVWYKTCTSCGKEIKSANGDYIHVIGIGDVCESCYTYQNIYDVE
jgi:hypothetical protein